MSLGPRWVPRAVVTSHHQVSGFNQQKYIFSHSSASPKSKSQLFTWWSLPWYYICHYLTPHSFYIRDLLWALCCRLEMLLLPGLCMSGFLLNSQLNCYLLEGNFPQQST
jgi:hypothetical protein